MRLDTNYVFTHKHSEDIDNTIGEETKIANFEENFHFTGSGAITKVIARLSF